MDFLTGMLKIANIFLSVVAGSLALSLFKSARSDEPLLRPWCFLVFALVLFALLEIVGGLRAFNIFETPFLTHTIVSVMLVMLIGALIVEIGVVKK